MLRRAVENALSIHLAVACAARLVQMHADPQPWPECCQLPNEHNRACPTPILADHGTAVTLRIDWDVITKIRIRIVCFRVLGR